MTTPDSGDVKRPDGARIYWETTGIPEGKPALYLHGGPGSGLGNGSYRSAFDPKTYLIVGIDQRGCGRSRPLATDDPATLDGNTTQALMGDIEAVREHLGIKEWLVYGVSWGTTLALAYALEHPDRVTELVAMTVTTTSRREVEWFTEGMGVFFPQEWKALAKRAENGERIVDAFARLTRDPNPSVRAEAADAWDSWENALASLDPNAPSGPRNPRALRENFAMLVTHYWSQDAFLPARDSILARAHQLGGIPVTLIHGRLDISSPVDTAWRLSRAISTSRLTVIENEGHGGPLETQAVRRALAAYGTRAP